MTNWEGGAFDAGCVNACLTAVLSRVMRVAGTIPTVTGTSALHSDVLVDLSQVMWGPAGLLWNLTVANWVSFDFNVSCSSG